MSTSATDVFWAAPPVSRTLAAATFAFSIIVYYTGLIRPEYIVFLPSAFLKLPPQIWRLFTPFFLTGPQLSILFDTYFLYTYGSKLETASPRFSRPGDFFFYIVFVSAIILVLNWVLIGGMVFSSALILAFAWTSCQDERGQKGHFLVFTVPALWIPYGMLLMTLVVVGPGAAKVQGTGLIAAHLHDFLTRLWPTFGGGRNLLETPAFVRRLFLRDGSIKRAYGTAFDPTQRASTASASGSGGVLPESWRSRGTGHRLGGD